MNTIKVKNVSRNNFDLSLDFVKEGKVFPLKPNSTCTLTQEEYDYVCEQCPGVFEGGFIAVVEAPENVDKVETNEANVMSDEDIQKMLKLSITTFKKRMENIDSTTLIGDIYRAARERNMDDKYIKAITDRAGEVDAGLVL